MANAVTKTSKSIILSHNDYAKLLEAYQKISEVLYVQKKKKSPSAPDTLYGIWEGVKIDEQDFQNAKKSLFPPSL